MCVVWQEGHLVILRHSIYRSKDTIPDISQSVSKSVSRILTPACHKIHFPASGRDEIWKLEEGPREDPPRNPVLLLFSQRREYKRYSPLTQDYFYEVCSNWRERKIFLHSARLLFLRSVVTLSVTDRFIADNIFIASIEENKKLPWKRDYFNLLF